MFGGCGGPAPPSEKKKQAAFALVMKLLTDNYHLCLDDKHRAFNSSFAASRKKVLADLKTAIGEVLWQDAMEGF